MSKPLIFAAVVIMAMSSGCFIEGTKGGSITYDGNFNISNNEFEMNGDVRFSGTNPPQERYESITLELYTEDGTLLVEEELGTLDGPSDKLPVSVSSSTIPYYIIFDSPDIWDGTTGVDYYQRSQEAHQGYQLHTATSREELPITPKD